MSAVDRFATFAPSWNSPPTNAFPITPSDAALLPFTTRSIRVIGAGTLRAACASGAIVNFSLAAGEELPGQFTRVFLTGTTATGIVGRV